MTLQKFTSEYLLRDGPIIKVFVYPPEPYLEILRENKESILNKEARALIDTGATSTCISETIIEDLGLISHNVTKVKTPTGIEEREIYDVSLMLPQDQDGLFDLTCPCVDFHDDPYSVLLGRDVLEHCTVIYNGWDKTFHVHT